MSSTTPISALPAYVNPAAAWEDRPFLLTEPPRPATLLQTEDPSQLPHAEFEKYLEAAGKLYEVGLHGGVAASKRRMAMDSQLVSMVQVADDGLNEAVARYNTLHAVNPIERKTLNLEQVALLREQGLYKPDRKLGEVIDRGTELHAQARNALMAACRAASDGNLQAAHKFAKDFSVANKQVLQHRDGFGGEASDQAHGTVRHWEQARVTADTASSVFASAAVVAATLNPITRAALMASGVSVGQVLGAVGIGTTTGGVLSSVRHGIGEAGRVQEGQQADRNRFIQNVANDTLNSIQTSLAVALAPLAVSHLAASSARAAAWAMTTPQGEAVSGAVIGAGVDVVNQGLNQVTHALGSSGLPAPEFSWKSVGVSALAGAASRLGGSAVGRMVSPEATHAATQALRSKTNLALDVTTSVAQTFAMNAGTSQPLWGTLDQNFNMLVSTVMLGRASAAHAQPRTPQHSALQREPAATPSKMLTPETPPAQASDKPPETKPSGSSSPNWPAIATSVSQRRPLPFPRGREGKGWAAQEILGGSLNAVSGHGIYNIKGNRIPTFVVPEGMAITILRPGIRLPVIIDSIPYGHWDGHTHLVQKPESTSMAAEQLKLRIEKQQIWKERYHPALTPAQAARAAEVGNPVYRDLHLYFEGAVTWLPGARIPNIDITPSPELVILSNNYRVDRKTTLGEIANKNVGHIELDVCTSIRKTLADGRVVRPRSLHGEEAVEDSDIDLPGVYMFDRYQDRWVPDPRTPQIMGWDLVDAA